MHNIETTIKDEIRSWSKEALEKINPNFNNLPPCPYAENAWADDKVGIGFKVSSTFSRIEISLFKATLRALNSSDSLFKTTA